MHALRAKTSWSYGVQVDALGAVWVSHKHADHMLGLPGILSARSANQPPLLVSCCAAFLLLVKAVEEDFCSVHHHGHFARLDVLPASRLKMCLVSVSVLVQIVT